MAGVGLGGSVLSALGGNKKTQQQQQQSEQQTTGTNSSNSSSSGEFSNTTNPLEPDYFSSFRQGLVPAFQQEYAKAQQPIYGAPQKASYVSNLNDLALGATENLKQQLASVGALNSGRTATGITGIQMGRMGNLANFYGQLPFMEEQARSGRVGNLLNMATNWAGRAPVGSQTSGTQSQSQTAQQIIDQLMKGNSSGTMSSSTPFGSGLLSNLGGVAGSIFGDMWGNYGDSGGKSIWGNWNKPVSV